MGSLNHQKLLDKCLYSYFVKKGMHETAEAFANEVDVGTPIVDAIESPEGFLVDWWDLFYSKFRSNQAEHAQESYSEAARTMDNVVSEVPFVVPSSSPQKAPFVTNYSHKIDQIPNMPQQREAREKAMLPVPDPFEKGSSSGGMQQTP